MLYKNLRISTIVDYNGFIAFRKLYKNLRISTIVDERQKATLRKLYKNLRISTIVVYRFNFKYCPFYKIEHLFHCKLFDIDING